MSLQHKKSDDIKTNADIIEVTTSNVDKLTTYQLRQELIKRNCLDIPENRINHRSMLERLIHELYRVEQDKINQHTSMKIQEEHEKLQEAKRIREMKKLEAIERSRQRQASAEYFKVKTELNKIGKENMNQVKSNEVIEESDSNDVISDSLEHDDNDDPFRSYNTKQRSKIYVK